jgi:hypothetical protein
MFFLYLNPFFVTTLALGSQPRQGLAKVWAKKELGSHISCSRKCKRMWVNEPPHSQMSSHFGNGVSVDSWIFRRWLQGPKLTISLRASGIPHTVEKLLTRATTLL